MSIMMNNADGSQSEVFTKDEHEKAVKDAGEAATKTAGDVAKTTAEERFNKELEEYKTANPSGAKEIEDLKTSITEKDAKIVELGGDNKGGDGSDGDNKDRDEQINRLREERKEAEDKLGEGLKEMGKQIQAITGDVKSDVITTAVKSLTEAQLKGAGGEAEARKKIETEFEGFAGDAVTRTDITERVTKAITLAIGEAPVPGVMDGVSSGGSKGDADHGANDGKEASETTKKVGTTLGISDEDRTKFGPGGEEDKSKGNA